MSSHDNASSEIAKEVRETFLGMLSYDVILSLQRMEQEDSQAARRDVIRTIFAAVEGYCEEYRDHVRSVAEDIEPFDDITKLALSETYYFVTEAGVVEQQRRFVPITSSIRLVTRLAKQISPEIEVDFSGSDWHRFRKAIAIRNRITHPKRPTDLSISDDDIKDVESAFFWLLDVISHVMAAMNEQAGRYLQFMRDFGNKLIAGDETALAPYEMAKRKLDT